MKTRFFKVQLLFVMLLISMKLSAAVVYPIVLNPQILPPYSNCLLDYAASKRFNVFALSRDMNHANYTFCLNIKMKHGNSYLIDKTVYDVRFTVASGVPKIVDITSLLDRVDNQSNEGFCYEEGAYEFIFQAFDANEPSIAVSEPAYLLAYLSKSEPPMCIYPNDNDCISPNIGGVINFSWTESFAAVPDPSRKFRIAIYEMPDGLFDEGSDYSTRQRKSRLNSLVETQVPIFMDETNVPFYSFINTTGKLQKNHTYLWRVQIYKDGTNPDGKYTTSGYYKNGGWSEPFTLRYRNCDPWSQETVKQEKKSDTEAPSLEVEVSDAVTISWKTDPDKYCGYRVGYNVKGQDSVIEWTTQTFAQNESSWVISKNITPGVDYVAKIEGITDCPDTAYTKSNKKDFKVQYKANNDCKSNIPTLSLNDNIEELKAGDIIDACGKSVKVTNVERNANGTFSGQGIALLPILSDWTGIRVKFEGIKVNSSKEMTSGHIESTTGSSPLTLNINGVANKQNAGTKTNLQKKIADSKPESSQVAIKVEGKKVSVSGNAIGTIVEKEEVGNISDEDKVGENGKITFTAKEYGNPVIDEGMSPFNGLQISSYYEVPGQWIALEAGMSTKLVAKFTKGDVDINLDSVSIYIQAEEDAVKIENLKWSATNECELTIFAGKETEHLNLIAVDKSKGSLNILGRAFIQSMKREEITLHLVPVRRNSSSVKNDAISERLNAIYNPLGKHFTVEVEDQFDEKKELGFLDDGLDVSETSLLSLESKEMKELTQAYVDAHPGIEDSKDAYIFICPSAKDKNVKGDMPRNKSIGYVFSSATTYGTDTDAWTIAHELGHGIFDLEHTFDFGVNKNTTKNLMDYNQGTETKVWQWTVMDNHPSYTLPFLEDAEDSQWTTDGHYYLFTYLGLLLGLDYETAKKYGQWAEEPDTYLGPNGIVYYENTTWLKPYLQQRDHALTGGYHGVELAATLYALHKLKENPNYIDPLTNKIFKGGAEDNKQFLFHRFGDCFAHSNISENMLPDEVKIDDQWFINAINKYVDNVYIKIDKKPSSASDTIVYKNGKFYTSYEKDAFTREIVNAVILSQDIAYMSTLEYLSSAASKTAKVVSNALLFEKSIPLFVVSYGIDVLSSGDGNVLRQIDNDICITHDTKGLEEIWKGLLKTLGSNNINDAKMYGGPANQCLAFTEGHMFAKIADVICQRPKLFKYYTQSAINLLCDIEGNAKKTEKKNAYYAIESVVDWAKTECANNGKKEVRLDGVFAFLIEYENQKRNNTSSDHIEVNIPIKYLTPNANDFEILVNLAIAGGDVGDNLYKQANNQLDSLIEYLKYCKNKNKYPDLNLDGIENIKLSTKETFNFLTITLYKKNK